MKPQNRRLLWLLAACLISAGVPLFFAAWLNALDMSLLPVWILILCVNLLNYARLYARGWIRKTAAWLHVVCYASGAVVIFVYTIVIPFPLYKAWTGLVQAGAPPGSISTLFAAGSAWFAALLAGCLFTTGWPRPVCGLAAVVLFLATVIYRDWVLCLAALLLFLVNAVMLVLCQWKFSGRVLRTLIMPLVVSLVLALFFSSLEGNKAGFLSYYSLSPSVRAALEAAFPALSSLTLSPGYDDARDTARLGGRALTSRWPVYRVQAEPGRTLYLRMKVYDQYTGNSWEISPSLAEKTGTEYEKYFFPGAGEPDVHITQLLDYSLLVPHTLATRSFTVMPEQPGLPAYGSKAAGFGAKLPFVRQSVIRLYEAQPAPGSPGMGAEEDILAYYRQLPAALPAELRQLTAQWQAGTSPAAELADTITRYLEDTCLYSLDADYPAAGRDFTADFLFTKQKGYCVHFATAAAVLFRLCGIPSRYVKGYFARIPRESNTTVCTGLSYHAWTEIYVPGAGWQTVEATPPHRSVYLAGADYAARFNPGKDDLLGLQLTYLAAGEIPVRQDKTGSRVLFSIIVLLVFACLIFCLILLYRFLKKSAVPALRYKGCRKELQGMLLQLVKRGSGQGIRHPCFTGWDAWLEEWGSKQSIKPQHTQRVLSIIRRVLFSPDPGRNLDVRFMKSFCRKKGKRIF